MMIRSKPATVDSLWATMTTVERMPRMFLSTCSWLMLSRAEVASSRISTLGRFSTARASRSIWRWPPEKPQELDSEISVSNFSGRPRT